LLDAMLNVMQRETIYRRGAESAEKYTGRMKQNYEE